MHPAKVDRAAVSTLTDLPNIGPAMARDLTLLGITTPKQLRDQDPLVLYRKLCAMTGQHHDPCVLDVFMSIVAFMRGQPAQPWWAFTAERKRLLAT